VSPLLLYFASGDSLYPGVGLLVAAILSKRYETRRWLAGLRICATWIGLAMIVMACPPFPWGVDLLVLVVFFVWLAAGNRDKTGWRAVILTLVSFLLLILLAALAGVEYLHRRMHTLHGTVDNHLVVIGDSISAGIGDSARAWPAIMQGTTGAEIKNLAKAGAVMADGLTMAGQIGPSDHLVLMELGGNDLIAGQSSKNFASDLERVLAKLAIPGRTIVMFELPLIPTVVGYGQAQRRLAAKYDVVLIPKRFLANVLAGPKATSDGLHLTDIGAERMARMIAEILSPVLKAQLSVVRTHSSFARLGGRGRPPLHRPL
jgi:lysophospholipase L1-like esterase